MEYNNYTSGGTTTLLEKKSWSEESEVNSSASISCFVLLENSEDFCVSEKSYNLKILGQPMFTWVARACPAVPVTIECMKGANPLEVIRPYLKNSEYTVVLYSDTPLVTKANVEEILDYVKNKGLNVCKLTRGWVYKTDYIKRVGEVFAPQTYYFDEEDFIMAVNFKQLQMVSEILKSRILDFHMKNGVYFTNPDIVEVEANVSIGGGTIVSGACRLLGKTQIGENCKIDSSTLDSAKLFDNVRLNSVSVEKSVIESEVCVDKGSYVLDGSLINKNSIVGKNNIIKKTSIGENVKIEDDNFISSARIHDLSYIGSCNKLLGEEHKVVRILSNAKIQNGTKIVPGVMIGESVNVPNFKVVTDTMRQGE